MKDNFKKTIIWTNVEPPKNYLWARNNKVYEYSKDWCECEMLKEPCIPVEEITLNKSKVNLKPGRNTTLTIKILPEDTTEKCITWISSNPEIVSVSSGKLSAKSEGVAMIYAAVGGKYAECEIHVSQIS